MKHLPDWVKGLVKLLLLLLMVLGTVLFWWIMDGRKSNVVFQSHLCYSKDAKMDENGYVELELCK